MNQDSIRTLMATLLGITGEIYIVSRRFEKNKHTGNATYYITLKGKHYSECYEMVLYRGVTHNIPEDVKQMTLSKLELLKTFVTKEHVDSVIADMKTFVPGLFTDEKKEEKKEWTESEIYNVACEIWDDFLSKPRYPNLERLPGVIEVPERRANPIKNEAKNIVRRILEGEHKSAVNYITSLRVGSEFTTDEVMLIIRFAYELLDKISPEAYKKWSNWQDGQVQETLKAKMSATKPEKSVKDISDELLGDVADLIEKAQQIVDGADEGLVNMVTPNFVVEEFNKGLTKMFSVLADSIAPTIRHNNSLARTGSYLAIEAYLDCIALSRHAEKALTLMDDELNRTLLRVIIKRILASGLTETLADKDESMVAEWDKMATVFGVIDEDDTTLSTILAEVELEHGKALNDNQIEFLTILIHLANNVANYVYFREFIEEEQESQKIRDRKEDIGSMFLSMGKPNPNEVSQKILDTLQDPTKTEMTDEDRKEAGKKLNAMFSSGREMFQKYLKDKEEAEKNGVAFDAMASIRKHMESGIPLAVAAGMTGLGFGGTGVRVISSENNSFKDFHNRNMSFYKSLMGTSEKSSGCSCGGKGCKK